MKKIPEKFIPPHELSGMPESTPILVGFSGGADSSALLAMLCEYRSFTGATIYAAHVNHGIRGEEADRDETFCKRQAEKYGVKIFTVKLDVPSLAKERGQSIETAARDARYEFFRKIMDENDIPLLATAHNANDNLETMIFNMTRGCGISGMCGIPAERRIASGTVVRPILRLPRSEIVEYCSQMGISYVTDSTNTDTDYTRNKIRAEIIPILSEINPSAVESASRLSVSLRADSLCLDSMAEWFLSEMREGCSVEAEKLIGSPAAIENRAIMALYEEASGGRSLETVHVDAIRRLCERAVPHSSADLPGGFCAVIENKRLCFVEATEKDIACDDYFIELFEGNNPISQTKAEIVMGNSHKPINIYKKSIQLYLDSAKINGVLYARGRRAGDKIRKNKMSKSIKKLLCDMKIPLELRARIPIICDGDGIVAVPFIGVRDGVAGSETDEGVLKITFYLY